MKVYKGLQVFYRQSTGEATRLSVENYSFLQKMILKLDLKKYIYVIYYMGLAILAVDFVNQ